ncbi:TPA: phage tail protein [Pseudomonas aeruginosa]|uniref:phage tail protein n=1 Tax=Pseudomonas aeruginosa TaxID=287 RepID=UPI000E322739|nr:phage tail protein [Pseudomonas aeruginosa]EIU2672043.1 phage tail protein [Pseudomonas aeruginosa]EKU7999835.1 phage tail protein [Pseudomonas aeruginosa]EKV2966538.1 phage tail protein [Pseudomonas aeruginosa]EKV2993519.1 phage tail protein [Pseudomonas aeruginosa]EKX4842666.1 phage tail protein [Pseudomonas aeruginosa]
MYKPDSLRATLLASVPQLKHDHERLLMFIDQGSVRCTAAASLSYEYAYSLQIILTDFPGSPDAVMLPLLGWLREHQSELLANLDKVDKGIEFEVDILDKSKVDMAITLPLTERVVVKRLEDGTYNVVHAPEPQYQVYENYGPMQFIANGELLTEWTPPPAPDAMALVTPHPRRPSDG